MDLYSVNYSIRTIPSIFWIFLWFAIPVFLFTIFWKIRLFYKRSEFLKKVKWDFLEMRISGENMKTPKAMEQVFASLFGIYSFGNSWGMKYLKGKIDLWISFEIVGSAEGIRFFIRTPSQYRNLLESALYAQYPDAEIIPADDYAYMFGKKIPNEIYDLWGTGFTLTKSRVYPIRTYQEFEEIKEEKSLDPLATIFEAMSKLKGDETVFIQLIISPTGSATGVDINKEGEKEIKRIMEEKAMVRRNKEGEEEKMTGMFALTPGIQEIIKAIERKTSRTVFETTLRFVYIDRRDGFNGMNISSIMGAFQQFNFPQLNSLRPDRSITIFGGWKALLFPIYKNIKINIKKRRLFYYYSTRRFGNENHLKKEKFPVFSIEELATLYHFPRHFVGAPGLKSPFSRKGGAPSNLPVADKGGK